VSEPDDTTQIAAALERLLPRLWEACFTPLPPGIVVDLPVGQARTLIHLAVAGRRRMGELAEDLGVKRPGSSTAWSSGTWRSAAPARTTAAWSG
jgi:hypothetical protein